MRFVALILSLFLPGLGQVLLNRYARGAIIFLIWVITVDLAVIILPCFYHADSPNHHIISLLYLIAFITYSYNIYDIFRVAILCQRISFLDRRKSLFKDGIVFYLRNDLNSAQAAIGKLLSDDSDDRDGLFYLARIYQITDNRKKYFRLLNRCYNLDTIHKWQRVEE